MLNINNLNHNKIIHQFHHNNQILVVNNKIIETHKNVNKTLKEEHKVMVDYYFLKNYQKCQFL